jgi:hypothetical protein
VPDLRAPTRGVAAGRLDIDVPAIRMSADEYRRIGRFESDYPHRDGPRDADGVPEVRRSIR